MPGNVKWYCIECGWAAKGRCPRHPGKSLSMGKRWRPGKKGRKTRLWDNRVHGSVTAEPPAIRHGAWPSPYGSAPFSPSRPVPRGLIALGARDFSRNGVDSAAGFSRSADPVRRAISEKSRKPSMEHLMKLPSKEPGWPFPCDWTA
jgi:hypothetical protein